MASKNDTQKQLGDNGPANGSTRSEIATGQGAGLELVARATADVDLLATFFAGLHEKPDHLFTALVIVNRAADLMAFVYQTATALTAGNCGLAHVLTLGAETMTNRKRFEARLRRLRNHMAQFRLMVGADGELAGWALMDEWVIEGEYSAVILRPGVPRV